MKGKKILITAGPTREYLDPVRFITNESSGKMGYAIAEVLFKLGAELTLVSGPVAIFTAAIADHRPRYPSDNKITPWNSEKTKTKSKYPLVLHWKPTTFFKMQKENEGQRILIFL